MDLGAEVAGILFSYAYPSPIPQLQHANVYNTFAARRDRWNGAVPSRGPGILKEK